MSNTVSKLGIEKYFVKSNLFFMLCVLFTNFYFYAARIKFCPMLCVIQWFRRRGPHALTWQPLTKRRRRWFLIGCLKLLRQSQQSRGHFCLGLLSAMTNKQLQGIFQTQKFLTKTALVKFEAFYLKVISHITFLYSKLPGFENIFEKPSCGCIFSSYLACVLHPRRSFVDQRY